MTRAADKSVEWPEREEAFKVLMGPRLDRAYGLAWHVLAHAADAEDACQEALLAAWSAWPRLRDPARFDAWFGRILVNACRDQLRNRGRTPLSLDAGPGTATDYAYGPTSRVTADQTDALANHEALGLALRTLSPDQREVIVLRYYFDLTVDQIAARTGARQGTVKSRLHHALRYLRSAIDPANEEQHLRPRQGLDIEEMIALLGVEPLHIGVELGYQLAHLRPARIGLLDDDEFLRSHAFPSWSDNSVAAFNPSKTASSAVRGAKASPMR